MTKQEVVTCHQLVIQHWQSDTSPPFWHLCPTEMVRITTKTINLPSKQLLNLLEVAGLQTRHVTEYKKRMARTYLLQVSSIGCNGIK